MSLVHFKNLLVNIFYKKDIIATSRNEDTSDQEPLLQAAGRSKSIGSDTTAHDGNVDIESQLPEKSGYLQGFKVDARIISDATSKNTKISDLLSLGCTSVFIRGTILTPVFQLVFQMD